MGCFNMKCALTQLPICEGDPVVMLFGYQPSQRDIQSDNAGGYQYQDHFFKLITTPIFGTYNDYGWIDNIDEQSASIANKTIRAMGYDFDIDFIEGHWNDELGKISKRNYGYVVGKQTNRNFDYTFIHRKTWDSLLSLSKQHNTSVYVDGIHTSEEQVSIIEACNELGIKFAKGDPRFEFTSIHYFAKPDAEFKLLNKLIHQIIKEPTFEMNVRQLIEQKLVDESMLTKFANGTISEVEKIQVASYMFMVNGGSANLYISSIKNMFGWFGLLNDTDADFVNNYVIGYNAKTYNMKRIKNLLTICNTDEYTQTIFSDLSAVYKALLYNQIVVRGQADIPTQSQESNHWGLIAVVQSSLDILSQRAELRRSWSDKCSVDLDEFQKYSLNEKLKYLVDSELDGSY